MAEITDIFELIEREQGRQRQGLNLIASENRTSGNVLRALGSVLTNKYAEGYPGNRWYAGCSIADQIETYAIEGARELYGADWANVQPHSGTSSNVAAYLTLLKPGDRVLAFNLSHGGHLSHGAPFNISGKFYDFVHYDVRKEDERIDTDQIRRMFKEYAVTEKPIKLMIAGASSYPRAIDFEELAAIATEFGAYFLADIAHISGLVATGHHPDPVPVSDIITSSTHKTLRGPRGGIVLCRKKHKKALDRAVFPGSQGGPMEHVIAAKAVMFDEARTPEFKEYIGEVVAAAKKLAESLQGINDKRYRIISGGTDNHMVMADVTGDPALEMTGKVAESRLEEQGIYINKNFIPYDPLPVTVTSGIRLGTPMIVTMGATAADMPRVAEMIDRALSGEGIKVEVESFMDELAGRDAGAPR